LKVVYFVTYPRAIFIVKPLLIVFAVLISLRAAKVDAGVKTVEALPPDMEWKVNTVAFKGNKALSDTELSKTMQTKSRPVYLFWQKRRDFDPFSWKTDIERLHRLYESEGYYHARIDYVLETKGYLIDALITINEGPQVRVNQVKVRVEGRDASGDLITSTPLKQGSAFTEKEYQRGESILKGYFLDLGYGRATAERTAQINPDTNQASVFYSVKPGPLTSFGATTIEGAREVESYIVTRELVYKKGDLFSPKKITDSRKKILALQLFSAVEFKPDLQSKDASVLPITVKVTEKPRHDIKLGGGYGTQDEFRIQAQWADHNFLGDARELTLTTRYSTVESAGEVKLLQRHFPSLNQQMVLDGKLLYETETPFTLTGARILALLQGDFSKTLSGSAGFRTEIFKVTSFDRPAVLELGGIRTKGFLAGPTAQLSWDATDDPFNPTRGAIITVAADQAGEIWGGQANYYKMTGEVRKYTSIGWDAVLANRFKIGFADSLGKTSDGVPIFERFYSGGPGSVRGYGRWDIGPRSTDNVPLGGLSVLEGAVEVRRPIYKGLTGAAFVDFGDVSLRSFHPPITNLKFGFGPALMYTTPVGPVRLDLGFPFQKPRGDQAWQIYFSIGQYF
jgi:outer membrane protein assembly complex protein YaeT